MVTRESEEAISVNIDRYVPILISEWEGSRNRESRKKILALIAKSDSPPAVNLIKQEVENKDSSFRYNAFSGFCAKNRKEDSPYIRNFISDQTLRPIVLKYIFEQGDKSDKQLMLDVLSQENANVTEFTTALSAIQKWGTLKEQEDEYTRALENRIILESSKYFAILLFKEFRSEAIRDALCELTKNASDQNVRLTSAEALIPFQSTSNIGCMQKIAKESYIPTRSGMGVGDALAMFLTLGLSNVMRGIQENKSKASFNMRLEVLKKHLQFLEQKALEAK
jgi:hypothetical protein